MSKKKKTIIEYRHYSLPLNFPVLLLSGDRWRISEVKSGRLHFHNCLEIGVCHSDSGVMEFEHDALHFNAGDITCVPRHLPHTTYSDPGTASLWSYIFVDPQEIFSDFFLNTQHNFESPMELSKYAQYIFDQAEHPKMHALASMIVDEMKHQQPNYQESVKGLLLSLYIELLRIHRANMANAGQHHDAADKENVLILSPVLSYVQNNYMQPIPIESLADLCHMSLTHFRRTFHEIMGTTPLDFLNSTRIEEACRLLRTTEDSILDISEAVGFRSISSFNRSFTKLMDAPPRTWRKQVHQSEAKSGKASILEFTGWH